MSDKTKVVQEENSVKISADKLLNFERTISDKDQTIGAQQATIDNLKQKVKELEQVQKSEKEIKPEDKVIVIREEMYCKYCGKGYNGSSRRCPNCGSGSVTQSKNTVEYRNFDSVVEDIRKEEAKKLQVDILELEEELSQAKFKHKKATAAMNELARDQEQELTEARSKVRESYKKEIENREKKIDELLEELEKVKSSKTDEEVEEARKQEIIDLKERITELNEELEDLKALKPVRRFLNRMTSRKERVEAEQRNIEKKERIDRISNQYPKTKANAKEKWWEGKSNNPFAGLYNWVTTAF